jgi:hypothetical protein
MTVFNTGYCTIDEAWGDLASKPKKIKKKTPQDPICDLYDTKRNSSNYNDTDLVRLANEYYDKSKYQRSMKTQPMAYEEVDRESPQKSLVINKNQNTYDVSSEFPQKPSQNNNSALFEKQFEMKLPPLYDTGNECPMPSESRVPAFRGQHVPPPTVSDKEWSRGKTTDDYTDDSIFMGNSSHMPTYAEVDDEHNLINYSSNYKMPVKKSVPTYTERFSEEEMPTRNTYSEEEHRPLRQKTYAEEERRDQGRNCQEEERTHFFDEYDEDYNYQSYKKKNSNLQILDLILYIISGIILIFLLEQFVKIGINMQRGF